MSSTTRVWSSIFRVGDKIFVGHKTGYMQQPLPAAIGHSEHLGAPTAGQVHQDSLAPSITETVTKLGDL